MPVCRNCNSRISNFDKDRCPVCGCVNPISQDHSETIEITSDISFDDALKKEVKFKKKWVALLLSILLPFFGTPFYYLRFYKRGLIWLICNVIAILLPFLLLFFFVDKQAFHIWSLLIPLLSVYAFNVVLGLYLFLKKDYKDGAGELVR